MNINTKPSEITLPNGQIYNLSDEPCPMCLGAGGRYETFPLDCNTGTYAACGCAARVVDRVVPLYWTVVIWAEAAEAQPANALETDGGGQK